VPRNDRKFNLVAAAGNLGVWCLWLPQAVIGSIF
jgi:hypothetical protein